MFARRNARRGLLASTAAGLLWIVTACGGSGLPDKVKYAAPPQAVLMGGVSVQFQLAHASDDVFKFRVYIQNLSNPPQMMIINRDGFGLRLPDGRVLQRRGSAHEPYMLQPGQGHDVWVDFKEAGLDLRTVQQASVIVGGIAFGNDPMPRVVGEIPLTWAGPVD